MSSSLNAVGDGGLTYSNSAAYSYVAPITSFYYQSAPSSGVASTDPNALASVINSNNSLISNGFASIQNAGVAEYASMANLFGQWGQNLNVMAAQSGSIAQEVANKSAKACSGFFGCLF